MRYEISPQPHAKSAQQRGCEAGDNPITVLPTPGNLEHEPCPNCTPNTFRHEAECSRSASSSGVASRRSPKSKLTNYPASGLSSCLWKSIRQMERCRSVSALERISSAQSSAQRPSVALVLEQLAPLRGVDFQPQRDTLSAWPVLALSGASGGLRKGFPPAFTHE